jgi:hypothetical protein
MPTSGRLVDQVELEHDDQVGEGVQPGDGVGSESVRVKRNRRFHLAPLVVDCVATASDDVADRLQRDHAGQR